MRESCRSVLRPAGLIVLGLFSLYGCVSGIKTPTGDSPPDTMAAFKSGNARLTCFVSCSFAWGAARLQVKNLYTRGQWVDLVHEVTRIGHDGDLSYFYLGQAAENLGYEEAARTYYQLSLSAIQKCEGRINVCDGFDVSRLAKKSLTQIDNKRTELAQQDRHSTTITSSVESTAATPNDEMISAASKQSIEVPPISVNMWMQILPPENQELTSDWLLGTIDKLGKQSKALRLSKKRSEALVASVQSTLLSEYYIEIENFHDAAELKSGIAKNLEPLNKLGITKKFYDESYKNLKIAIPEGTIISSSHANGTVFGKALGARFSVPECKKRKYGGGYYVDMKTTCFEHVVERNVNQNDFTGYIRVISAYGEIPDVVHGVYYYALLINGKLEGINFDTGGLQHIDYVYGELQKKYGEPSIHKIRTVKNLYGATFDVMDVQWTVDNTIVTFLGVTDSIDRGSVNISTKNGLMYRHEQRANTNKENSL